MKNSRCLEKLGHPIGQKEWRISDQLPIRQYIWKNQHKIRPWSYVNSKSRVLTITTWGPQPHNSSFYMQSLSNFIFGCSSHRTDLDWLWSQQSSCQGTCLRVRGGKDPCRIGITGAGTLVGRRLGWPRTTCESCSVTSERMAGAQSLSVRIQLQPL